MHSRYAAQGLHVLAFPCNQFGGQEPDSVEDILKSTSELYGRTFPLMDKIDVHGPNALPLYKEMLDPEEKLITWNFHKFLVSRDGLLHGSYKPKVSPLAMEEDIKKLLASKL